MLSWQFAWELRHDVLSVHSLLPLVMLVEVLEGALIQSSIRSLFLMLLDVLLG